MRNPKKEQTPIVIYETPKIANWPDAQTPDSEEKNLKRDEIILKHYQVMQKFRQLQDAISKNSTSIFPGIKEIILLPGKGIYKKRELACEQSSFIKVQLENGYVPIIKRLSSEEWRKERSKERIEESRKKREEQRAEALRKYEAKQEEERKAKTLIKQKTDRANEVPIDYELRRQLKKQERKYRLSKGADPREDKTIIIGNKNSNPKKNYPVNEVLTDYEQRRELRRQLKKEVRQHRPWKGVDRRENKEIMIGIEKPNHKQKRNLSKASTVKR